MNKYTGIVIIGCWEVFFIYWLVRALKGKVIAEKQTRLSALCHRVPVCLGGILLLFQHLPPPLNRSLISHTLAIQIIGAVVCVLGLFITIWARRTLAGNWSSDVTFKQGHELIKAGPYRFVRHPIYTGMLAMCLGTAINMTLLRAWLAVLVMFFGFWIKIRQEEKLLLRHFPDAYPSYRKEVKALVPFVF